MSIHLDRAYTIAQYAAQDLQKAHIAYEAAKKHARAAQADLIRLANLEQGQDAAAILGA